MAPKSFFFALLPPADIFMVAPCRTLAHQLLDSPHRNTRPWELPWNSELPCCCSLPCPRPRRSRFGLAVATALWFCGNRWPKLAFQLLWFSFSLWMPIILVSLSWSPKQMAVSLYLSLRRGPALQSRCHRPSHHHQ